MFGLLKLVIHRDLYGRTWDRSKIATPLSE